MKGLNKRYDAGNMSTKITQYHISWALNNHEEHLVSLFLTTRFIFGPLGFGFFFGHASLNGDLFYIQNKQG